MIMTPMDESRARVAIVVLSWNGKEDTLRCLTSLAGVAYVPLEVIVVDNGSDDGSADAVEAGFPDAVVIRLGRNAGFAGGVNAGIPRIASGTPAPRSGRVAATTGATSASAARRCPSRDLPTGSTVPVEGRC
jgi:hypothetical protein